MTVQTSDLLVGILMNVFGLIGLVLASRALDDEMFVFGLSLAGFSYLFILGLIRRHFDTAQAAVAARRESDHA